MKFYAVPAVIAFGCSPVRRRISFTSQSTSWFVADGAAERCFSPVAQVEFDVVVRSAGRAALLAGDLAADGRELRKLEPAHFAAAEIAIL